MFFFKSTASCSALHFYPMTLIMGCSPAYIVATSTLPYLGKTFLYRIE